MYDDNGNPIAVNGVPSTGLSGQVTPPLNVPDGVCITLVYEFTCCP